MKVRLVLPNLEDKFFVSGGTCSINVRNRSVGEKE